jgi:hypothetical protein
MLIENPKLIKTLGENLYNTVNGKYDMKAVCEKRREMYLSLIKEKNNRVVENVI